MVLPCKQKAIYVKCCVIANGITDSQGDTLHTEDIKKIFTSFNNSNHFEIYHNEIPIDGVSLLENYISTADDQLGTSVVPKGSWLAVIRVDNPDIQEGLLTGKFKGVSLNNRIAPKCQANLQGYVRYEDITDKECVIPVYISFVESGANGYGLHVMDYDAYILKSKDTVIKNNSMEKKRMDFKEFMEGLKSLIKQAEETPKEDEAAVKEEDPKANEEKEPAVKKEETETAQKEEKEEEEKPAEIKKADKPQEDDVKDDNVAKTEEKPVEATEESLEERVAKLEKIIAELTAEKEESTDEKADETKAAEKEDEDTPKITKSEKVIIQEGNTLQNSNYYEMTGRDPITGVKIRNQSKIL